MESYFHGELAGLAALELGVFPDWSERNSSCAKKIVKFDTNHITIVMQYYEGRLKVMFVFGQYVRKISLRDHHV